MLIEVAGLSRSFGKKTVLSDVHLKLAPGEVVVLAGRNGAGKTTTLDVLMGFLEPHAGTVRVIGRDPGDRGHLAHVGFMPETPAYPRGLRISALLRFQRGTFPGWDAALVDRLLEWFELDPNAVASDLSRGQSARFALVLALSTRPKLLLLDDPALGLDPAGRRMLFGQLLGTAAEDGVGILLSTHLLAEIESAIDRVAILHQSRIDLDENVETLHERYRRLDLPEGAPPPPETLAVRTTSIGTVACQFSDHAWAPYARQVAAARAERLGIEDIFVAHTEP